MTTTKVRKKPSVMSEPRRAPWVSADPDPVPEGPDPGSTVVHWDTGDGSIGEVYVSQDGGEQKLFASGDSGSAEAPWIWSDTSYVFSLRSASEPTRDLAAIEVRKKYGAGRRETSTAESAMAADEREDDLLRLVLSTVIKRDANCIDVGGNEGRILWLMQHFAPEGRHICYEPIPELHRALTGRFPGVDVRCRALSNKRTEREFVHVRSHSGYSGFRERSYPGEVDIAKLTVTATRLDDDLPRDYVPSLLKIDVEGAEQEVLEGARETIVRHQPVIVFEHGLGGADHYGADPERVYGLICDDTQLRIFDFDGNGPYTVADFVATYERGARWNYVARRW